MFQLQKNLKRFLILDDVSAEDGFLKSRRFQSGMTLLNCVKSVGN